MVRKKFTEEQIIAVLREAEAGAKTTELCRKYGMRHLLQLEGEVRRPHPERAEEAEDAGG